ncbi:helix-turn-helix domain-containing protein [Streptomyces noursei]|uniref:helix-turn-helix domain-containing protein n=1 Tax=Streptomyces noursei TaxID=1971 RepID=UPI001E5EB0E8|nr:transposase family protein [Streptomyces noursei]
MARTESGSTLASRPRRHAVGAGAKHKLVFVDQLLATLIPLRHGATHEVLACWFGVDRSTVTRGIGEARPLLAQRGCTVTPSAPHTRRGGQPPRREREDWNHRRHRDPRPPPAA